MVLAGLLFSGHAQAAGSSAMGWGYNPYGQVGTGAGTEGGCLCIPTPTPVAGLTDATQIAGGEYSTLALHANGTVTAWGYNSSGQLGDGTTTESWAPVPVSGLANVVAVSAGYEHGLALLANGTVMAWGANYFGQLGVGGSIVSIGPESCGPFPCSKTPVQVPGLSDVIAIAATYRNSYALLADGTVMAWGYNRFGQLGDGVANEDGCECVEHPVPVQGVSGAMAISAGLYHAMALQGNGAVTTWGENGEGQIGNGAVVEAPPPPCLCVTATGVGGLSGPATEISAGGSFSLALPVGGTPQAWGYNGNGELGNGTATEAGCECIPTPGAVAGLTGVQELAAGDYHSLALLGDGSVRGWGYNNFGPVGDGTDSNRSAPVPANGVAGATEVSAGGATSFALIGPSRSLIVSLAGAGTGTVGGADGILCPTVNCVERVPDSQIQILRAEPAPGTGFAGFTGACTGTGTCKVKLDADKTVTATFGPPKGTKITKAKITQGKKPKKKKKAKASAKPKSKPTARAQFSFSAPGAVTGYQCMLVKPKPKKKKGGKKKAKAGGKKKQKKPKFSSCSSPKRYKKLKKGRYTFKVRARNTLGVDAKPAVRKFRIKR